MVRNFHNNEIIQKERLDSTQNYSNEFDEVTNVLSQTNWDKYKENSRLAFAALSNYTLRDHVPRCT